MEEIPESQVPELPDRHEGNLAEPEPAKVDVNKPDKPQYDKKASNGLDVAGLTLGNGEEKPFGLLESGNKSDNANPSVSQQPKLTLMQAEFVKQYMKAKGNGAKAARAMGKAHYATQYATDQMKQPAVIAAIKRRTEAALLAQEVTGEVLIHEMYLLMKKGDCTTGRAKAGQVLGKWLNLEADKASNNAPTSMPTIIINGAQFDQHPPAQSAEPAVETPDDNEDLSQDDSGLNEQS